MNLFLKLFALFTLIAFVISAAVLISHKARRLAVIIQWLAIAIGTMALLMRWYDAGMVEISALTSAGMLEPGLGNWLKTFLSHPPFTNLFEVLISLSWALEIVALIIEKKYRIMIFTPLAYGVAMLCQGAAFWALDAYINPIAPVLRSWWLHLHVAVAAFSYAAAIAAAIVSFIYLLRDKLPRWQLISTGALLLVMAPLAYLYGRQPWNLVFMIAALCVTAICLLSLIFYNKFSKLTITPEKLDTLAYHLVALTFVTLTLVLVTGSVWAHYSWGRFWSWDPKETWSLVAWLAYAVYLHLRRQQGWRGRRLAYLALLAILIVMFAFLGVNLGLFGAGLHSYGRG